MHRTHKKIKCFIGVPKEYEGKGESVKEIDAKNLKAQKYVKIVEISRALGKEV